MGKAKRPKKQSPRETKLKIVGVDNCNRDSAADILVAENVHPDLVFVIVELLNQKYGAKSVVFFVAKPDDYRLSRGMEDLV